MLKYTLMKLSYNWLNEFVDLEGLDPYKLAEELTMKAFEVEDIHTTGSVLDSSVVLGEILEITKHPDAEKLQITQTNIGKETLQIVCGGRNIKVGQKIPVALIGSKVLNRHDGSELEIKKSKIRGVESFGMLCSADELGFSEEHSQAIKEIQGDGIYLFADASNSAIKDITNAKALGTPINQILESKSDFIFEVGARSNRGDALSVYGQAREIAAVSNKKFKAIDLKAEKIYTVDPSVKSIKPKIAESSLGKDCTVFYTVNIEGVKVAPSPMWLQERLNAQGQKSINNIVDISNFVMLELGQPMHFYDRDKVAGDYLELRRAKPGEELTTLEEKTHQLNDINLVIADSKGPSSLAGVMGGLASSISDTTTNVVIEVAIFNSAAVRKSARNAGVESESKKRFERGVDKAMSRTSLLRAIELLQEVSQEQGLKLKIGEIFVAGDEKTQETKITLNKNQIKRLSGIEIPDTEVITILENLGIKTINQSSSSFEFSIPSHRQVDISREIDLIEEVVRIYGYDKIPPQAPSSAAVNDSKVLDSKSKKLAVAKITQSFIASGFSEAKLSSLIGNTLSNLDQKLRLDSTKRDSIEMDNPLSLEHKILRQSLVPGLIQAASRNYAYDKTIDIKLFELGKIYYHKDSNIEEQKLATIFVKNESNWLAQKSSTLGENFFIIKSIVEELYSRAKFKTINETNNFYSMLHPGISALVEEDKRDIGYIGRIHPSLCREWDLPEESYVMELSFPKLQEIKFKPISTNPIVERDMTVDSNDEVLAQNIIDIIKKECSKDLQKVSITSLYKRNTEGMASKSTTFRLKWQSANETLSGEDIDKQIEKLKLLLESSLGVTFRA